MFTDQGVGGGLAITLYILFEITSIIRKKF